MTRRLLGFLAILALVAAIVTELRKPASERTWEGRVAGFIPYDFRRPTAGIVRDAFWAPENPTIFTPRVFGVGWSVNVGRLVALARQQAGQAAAAGQATAAGQAG